MALCPSKPAERGTIRHATPPEWYRCHRDRGLAPIAAIDASRKPLKLLCEPIRTAARDPLFRV
ncbi:hypothetical protein EMGR_000817 [Emarellia grisea]